jgi:hypothetical protein
MTGGSHLSARGREEAGYRFGFDFLGRGSLAGLGRMASLGPFSIFIFFLLFFFCFLISFKTFAKILQFKPNFFQRFSKGVHIILSQ